MEINFSKKPCKNKKERILGIYLPLSLTVIVTLINIVFFSIFYIKNSDIHNKINALENKLQSTNINTNIIVRKLEKIKYKEFIKEYSFLNSILLKKNMRWSILFKQLESLLPSSVRIIVISPSLKNNTTKLNITAEAVDKDSQLKFIENILNNKSFYKPSIESESLDSSSQNIKFSMNVFYLGERND